MFDRVLHDPGEGDLEDALSESKRPRGGSLLLGAWRPAFHKQNYEDAVRHFTKGLALAPNAEALTKRGRAR